jgi:hypothetical protein
MKGIKMKCYNCGESSLVVLWAQKTIALPESIEEKKVDEFLDEVVESLKSDLDISKATVINQHPDPELWCRNCWHTQ